MAHDQNQEFSDYTGLILWGTKNIFKVAIGERTHFIQNNNVKTVECRLKGKRGLSDTNHEKTFLLAGDWVKFQMTTDGFGYITDRLERQNCLFRMKQEIQQAIVVNIDLLLIVSTYKQPPFRPRFIDRFLCLALNENIPVVLVINKIDLLDAQHNIKSYDEDIDSDTQTRLEVYKSLGVQIIFTSLINNIGIYELKLLLKQKVVGLVGQSGVGKSSIINLLIPKANRSIGGISLKYDRGRHTTIRPELIIGENFQLIDTPGIRELFPQEMDIGTLKAGFPDIFKYSRFCKLPDCSHRYEPSCAVQDEVGKKIHKDRYKSYQSLRNFHDDYENNKWNRKKR